MADIVHDHFTARAERYNRSSKWVVDPVLGKRMVEVLDIGPETHLLDVACGTGLVSKSFTGRVGRITGFDLTDAMAAQAAPYIDELVMGRAEDMPFEDGTFDRIICRQGTQFMDDGAAAKEMYRVLKPGGRVLLVNLCAYGDEDKDEYFEILRWRNPARKNFYTREDHVRLLEEAGFSEVVVHDYISIEDVDAWSDNGAIEESRRENIRNVYRKASDAFRALHSSRSEDGTRFFDHMLFGLATGVKPA